MGQAGYISATHWSILHSTLGTIVHFSGSNGTAYTRPFSVGYTNFHLFPVFLSLTESTAPLSSSSSASLSFSSYIVFCPYHPLKCTPKWLSYFHKAHLLYNSLLFLFNFCLVYSIFPCVALFTFLLYMFFSFISSIFPYLSNLPQYPIFFLSLCLPHLHLSSSAPSLCYVLNSFLIVL